MLSFQRMSRLITLKHSSSRWVGSYIKQNIALKIIEDAWSVTRSGKCYTEYTPVEKRKVALLHAMLGDSRCTVLPSTVLALGEEGIIQSCYHEMSCKTRCSVRREAK
mmetsp:Transcript_15379/g.23173  ORF Transcript_15379/g.23173 Transcript_15379/m.23173 type:complete len:107 (-) Transcript_15379:177-497(-)